MEDLLNIELVKLQDELVQLDKAVSHISKAEQLTDEVITNSREIQHKYVTQLQTIQDRYQEFLNKALEANQEKLGGFEEKQQLQIEELGNVLKKYVELGQKTETIANSHLEKALAKYNEYLQQNTAKTEAVIQSLSEVHRAEIEEIKKLSQAYREHLVKQEEQGNKTLEDSLKSNSDLMKKTVDVTEKQVTEVTTAHKKQIEEVNQVFQTYVDLTDSTSQLAREIRTTDFPKRLNEIVDEVNDFKNTVRNTFARIESVERNVGKVNEVDWKAIAEINKKIEDQNKKLNRNAILLYLAIAAGIASIVVSVVL